VLEATNLKFGIIFCSTKNAVDGVTEHLVAEGYQADRLHGDMSQAMRERVMKRFRDRKLEFLVATDVAARGIDVDEVEVVLNYDLPRDPEDYVHRIGRTGRAGRSGRAISFVTPREMFALDRIFRLTKIKIRREKMPTPAEALLKRTEALVGTVHEVIAAGEFHKSSAGAKALLANGADPETVVEALLYMLTHKRKAGKPSGTAEEAPAREREHREAPPRNRSRPSGSQGERPRKDYPPYQGGGGRSYGPRDERPRPSREFASAGQPTRKPAFRKERK
jgi:ATP-dependent RNA helicase DeaD